jgi:hypothetical protein
MKKITPFLLVLLGFLAVSASAQEISIQAQAEPRQVNVGENIRLQVVIEGQVNINGEPKMPDLPDFQVYKAGSATNFNIINGRVSSSLQFTFILVPKHTGTFTIGAVSIGYNNKIYSTAPIQITVGGGTGSRAAPGTAPVSPGNAPPVAVGNAGGASKHANEPVFITTQVDRHEVYMNEPVTMTFRFYSRIPILSQPQFQPPSTSGFWSEDLPPQKEYIATVQGVEYRVIEIKTALFPTTAGKLTIGPATLVVQIEDFNRRSMDPFADEFFRNFFSSGRQVALKSDPIQVLAKPIPEKNRPSAFSGTVGKWALSAKLDRQIAKVGEAVTLEIRIFGEGNVKSVGKMDLPPFTGFKVYDTISSSEVQKQEGRVRGVKTYRTLLRPEVTGNLLVPAIGYVYFDPRSEKFERVQVPELNLKVLPGDAREATVSAGTVGAAEASAPSVKVMAKDIRYLKTQVSLDKAAKSWGPEFWLAGFGLPPVLLAVIWFWRRQQDRLAADPVYARKLTAEKSSRAALRQAHTARMHKDSPRFYSSLSQALMGYLADQMGLSRSGVTQREITQRLAKAGAEESKINQLAELLDECDFARFAPGELNETEMESHEQLAEGLLTEFSRVLGKEKKA